MKYKYLFIILLAAWCAADCARAAIYVPDDYSTLCEAIFYAQFGETIYVRAGAYAGGCMLPNYSLKIIALSGSDSTFIVDNGFSFASGVSRDTVIDGFSFVNLNSTALYCRTASPQIRNCKFINCHAHMGAAVRCIDNSAPRLLNCDFIGNYADLAGGAVYCWSSPAEFLGCRFVGNTAQIGGVADLVDNSNGVFIGCRFQNNGVFDDGYSQHPGQGGALSIHNSSPIIRLCAFYENTAVRAGGAIRCYADAAPQIIACLFMGNEAPWGGAVYSQSASPKLIESTFECNEAYNYGGAVDCSSSSSPYIAGCRFVDNIAAIGGGVSADYSTPELISCLFAYNSAELGSAVRFHETLDAQLTNCTIADNQGTSIGGAMSLTRRAEATVTNCIFSNDVLDEIYQEAGVELSVSYSNIQGGYEPGTAIIDDDPQFQPGPFADYYLAPASTSIGRGSAPAASLQYWAGTAMGSRTMSSLTTQSDHTYDAEMIDLGMHWLPELNYPQRSVFLFEADDFDLSQSVIADHSLRKYLAVIVGDGITGVGYGVSETGLNFTGSGCLHLAPAISVPPVPWRFSLEFLPHRDCPAEAVLIVIRYGTEEYRLTVGDLLNATEKSIEPRMSKRVMPQTGRMKEGWHLLDITTDPANNVMSITKEGNRIVVTLPGALPLNAVTILIGGDETPNDNAPNYVGLIDQVKILGKCIARTGFAYAGHGSRGDQPRLSPVAGRR